MASSSLFPSISFVLYTTFLLQPISAIRSTPADGFVVRLIHRDSPLSPLYNSSMTTHDRIQAAVYRSIARLNHIQSLTTTTTTTFPSSFPDYMIARAVPGNGEYIATFYVGTPPTKAFALIDTASEVSWVKCSQIYPIFNPEKSSSYSHFPCDSLSCDALGAGRRICQGNEPCSYRLEYTDGSITRGTLSHDKFAFGETAAQLVDIGYLDFGCSNYSSSQFAGQQTGALGLNQQTMSFVSQLGIKKFSYCMVSPDNEFGGVMYFGSQAVISGGQTPFLDAKDDAYYVNVTGISIGDQNVPLPDGIFDLTSDGEGGFIIDSGATYTMLRPEAFDALVKALGENIHLPQRRYRWFELCFVGSFEELESAGPDITFNFDGAVVMLLKQTSYIEVEKGVWCLAMIRSRGKLSTLGNIQQRHYFVGFDLEEQVVSFAPVNCAIF